MTPTLLLGCFALLFVLTKGELYCVTGATGFIATELIVQLLEQGHNVRGTVRSLTRSPHKTRYLRYLQSIFPNRLTLYEADLVVPGSFDRVVLGVDYVMHTASPFIMNPKTAQEVLDPAIFGTENIMRAAIMANERENTIKRVVITSSVAAVRGPGSVPANGRAFTEDDWNKVSNATDGGLHIYFESKVLAERNAWDMHADLVQSNPSSSAKHFDLVVINPSLVIGPVRVPPEGFEYEQNSNDNKEGKEEKAAEGEQDPSLPTPLERHTALSVASGFNSESILWMVKWLTGRAPSFHSTLVDVRDVAEAHIAAANMPTAGNGRYIVVGQEWPNPAHLTSLWLRTALIGPIAEGDVVVPAVAPEPDDEEEEEEEKEEKAEEVEEVEVKEDGSVEQGGGSSSSSGNFLEGTEKGEGGVQKKKTKMKRKRKRLYPFDGSKVHSMFGLEYRPVEDSVIEMAWSVVRARMVKKGKPTVVV